MAHYQRAHSQSGSTSHDISELIRRRVCERLQSELGSASDDADLSARCNALLEQQDNQLQDLRQKADVAEQAFLERKSQLIADGERTQQLLLSATTEATAVLDRLRSIMPLDEDNTEEMKGVLDKINQTNMQLQYLQRLESIHDQCDRIRSSLACGAMNDALNFLQQLLDWCNELQSSKCSYLQTFLYKMTVFWTRMVADRVAQDLPAIFVRIGYPKPPSLQKNLSVAIDGRSRYEIAEITKILLKMQLPDFVVNCTDTDEAAVFLEQNLPVKYFVVPLEKRFRFHFYVSDKTNKIDKPEWYFTQLLSWIKDYADFLANVLHPVFQSEGFPQNTVKVDFVRALACLGRSKFLSSVPLLLKERSFFAHAVDELLVFSRHLVSMGYETVAKEFCRVLIIPEIFNPWFEAESLLIEERLDSFITAPGAWKNKYREGVENPEEMKVPHCSQQFVLMLRGLNDRFLLLPSAEHELKFVQLLLCACEDYISDMKSFFEENQEDDLFSATQSGPALAAGSRYLYDYLQEFGNSTLIIQLLSSSTHNPPSANARLAEELFDRLSAIQDDLSRMSKTSLLRTTTDAAMNIARPFVREYARMGWKTTGGVMEYVVPSLTPVIGELIYSMKTILSAHKERLLTVLYENFVREMMTSLDFLIFNEVIMKNSFSPGGAGQLKFDIMHNLLVALQRLTNLPNAGLTKTVESCSVLFMLKGSALLLLEVLDSASKGHASQSDRESITRTLTELNVKSLTSEEVAVLLRKRGDLEI
ncbi:RAD50-interacting protein 1-like [Paramacrobiotus metropolitanus]|uniref:RAD50-interacting protein 1-like n=1 Tax=Paramacrobiotus metropolitanus TaxID=2943436 RepID=UPI0024457DC5|nr:RAD50-interacting protein 1-like [Paramacrobiotus metropolitanus]